MVFAAPTGSTSFSGSCGKITSVPQAGQYFVLSIVDGSTRLSQLWQRVPGVPLCGAYNCRAVRRYNTGSAKPRLSPPCTRNEFTPIISPDVFTSGPPLLPG